MNFYLDIKDHGHRDSHHGADKWDYSWSEDHDYTYGRATIVEKGYSDVTLFPGEAEVEVGDDIHVVYVSYDTGDSFGREYGCRTHLWAFSDRRRAYRLVETVREDAEAEPDYDFDHKPLMFDDVPISTNDWKGYFERFNHADVETICVGKKIKERS
jgi:hypothetical protein